jgi:polyphosphate kinase
VALELMRGLSEVRKSGLTFAVETPLEQNQRSLNKPAPLERIIEVLLEARGKGWHKAKFYFMVGLPQTIDGDEAGAVASFLRTVRSRTGMELNVNIGTFVPKPHTPFQWARQLEENGVHVVYGLVGYKIHAKVCLVVRREGQGIRRYVHLATGNYNPSTARLYTDLGLFTCRPDFGEDVTNLFNLLTGICQFQGMKKLVVAPFDLQARLLQLIEREAQNARKGLPARIIVKLNSLVEQEIIEALYRASQAGVNIDLVVRGICCLRPGVKGVSENITVRSIVDRFLEHSRVYYFENACQPDVLVSSADWMSRNLFRRIEVTFPIEDGNLRERLISEILAITLADNVKARILRADGTYGRALPAKDERPRRSQSEFIRLAAANGPRQDESPKGRAKDMRVRLAASPFAPRKRGE